MSNGLGRSNLDVDASCGVGQSANSTSDRGCVVGTSLARRDVYEEINEHIYWFNTSHRVGQFGDTWIYSSMLLLRRMYCKASESTTFNWLFYGYFSSIYCLSACNVPCRLGAHIIASLTGKSLHGAK